MEKALVFLFLHEIICYIGEGLLMSTHNVRFVEK